MAKKQISKLEDHIGYWLRFLSNYIHNSFESKLNHRNISVAQWVVLRTLYDEKGIGVMEAAKMIGIDKSSLSRMIDRLIDRGLVVRTQGDDRRSVNLSLTAAAKKLV